MSNDLRERVSGVLPALYAVALLILLLPSLELLAAIMPMEPGSVRWRFGAVGFAFQTFTTLLLGLALAAFVALALGHRGAARAVALVAAFLGAAVLLATAFVTLDFLQLRGDVVEGARTQFDRAGWKMVAQGLLAGPTLLALALGTWRGTRDWRAGAHAGAAQPKPGSFSAIVVEGAGSGRE